VLERDQLPKQPQCKFLNTIYDALKKLILNRTAAPPPKTQGYSSIFDQLRERQKKDEEEAALRAKGGKVPEKEEEVTKKGKKKKTVRWKPDNLLAEVTLFQVLEPIGEYYGGGDGKGHVFGDARSLDVEEGKDALAALKNRKALEDEEDIYIDWYQPIGQPPTPFAFPLCFLRIFIVRLFLYSELCKFLRRNTFLAKAKECLHLVTFWVISYSSQLPAYYFTHYESTQIEKRIHTDFKRMYFHSSKYSH